MEEEKVVSPFGVQLEVQADATAQLQQIVRSSEDIENINSVNSENQKDFKVYTKNEVSIGTYFGGPLAGCYMLSKNFENFGDKDFSKKVLKIGVISTVIFFAAILFIPESITSKIPKSLIPVWYTLALYYYADKFQGKKIEEYIKGGGRRHSGWKVFGVLLLSSIVLFLYVVAVSVLSALIFG